MAKFGRAPHQTGSGTPSHLTLATTPVARWSTGAPRQTGGGAPGHLTPATTPVARSMGAPRHTGGGAPVHLTLATTPVARSMGAPRQTGGGPGHLTPATTPVARSIEAPRQMAAAPMSLNTGHNSGGKVHGSTAADRWRRPSHLTPGHNTGGEVHGEHRGGTTGHQTPDPTPVARSVGNRSRPVAEPRLPNTGGPLPGRTGRPWAP